MYVRFEYTVYACRLAIKKPWRIISWGVSFNDLHSKCDGSHPHGQCAGRKTRTTQLYTEEIVKCIMKGLKNRMLLNNVYGRKTPSTAMFKNAKVPKSFQASPCIIMESDDCLNSQALLFSHWFVKRCGVKVKLDVTRTPLAVLADPDHPRLPVREAMAEERATVSKGNLPEPPPRS